MSATGEQTIPLSISGYKEISEKQIPIRTVATPGEQTIPLAVSGYLEMPAQSVPITVDGFREIDFQFIPLRLADQSTLSRGGWLAPLLKYLTQVGKVISVELAQGLTLTLDLSLTNSLSFAVFCYDVTAGGDLESASSYYDAEEYLPFDADLEYRATVAWGDGNFTQISAPGYYEHTYATTGTYTVHIRGHLPHFTVAYTTSWAAITAASWQRGLTTLVTFDTFWDLSNMTSFQAHPDALANVRCHEYTWESCSSLTSFPPMNFTEARILHDCWDTCTALTAFPIITLPNAQILDAAWRDCTALTSFPALALPACTDLDATWQNCTALTSFPALDLTTVVRLPAAWKECESLTSFPEIPLPNAVTFTETWEYCRGLTSFPALDLPAGRNFRQTWKGCSSLTSFPSITLAAHPGNFVGFEEAWRDCSSLSSFPAGMFDVYGDELAELPTDFFAYNPVVSTTLFYRNGFKNTWNGCAISHTGLANIIESVAIAHLYPMPEFDENGFTIQTFADLDISVGSEVVTTNVFSNCLIFEENDPSTNLDDEVLFSGVVNDNNIAPRTHAANFMAANNGRNKLNLSGPNIAAGIGANVRNDGATIVVSKGTACELNAISSTTFSTSIWNYQPVVPK